MPKPRFPQSRPDDIPFDVWMQLAKHPHCSNYGLECSNICQPIDNDGYYDVHVHHIISRARGGASTLENLQVTCACRNFQIGPRPDPNFSKSYYFDQLINTEKLRLHQLERAYNIPQRTHRDLFLKNYSLVLDNKMLLFAWLMGAGKTIGVCAFLFAINQLRAPFQARRIRRVLWMVHRISLVELVKTELGGNRDSGRLSELVEYGIIDNAPDVYAPPDTNALFSRPHADIVCIPPQRLYEAEGRLLSDEQRRDFLSGFDAIVVDEGHFGIDRYLNIIKNAPQALKICITASPMDGDTGELLSDVQKGKYKKNFVLVSTYGYEDGRDAGIYKQLLDFDEGRRANRYFSVEGGESEIAEGENFKSVTNPTHNQDVHRTKALAAIAARTAEQLDRLNGGPNLVMMRLDGIEKARLHAQAMNEDAELAKHGALAVYAGSTGKARLGHPKNPWMMVAQDGKFHGVRFLVCVDLGQIGLNNRFCSIIVWRDSSGSLIEIIQRIGRALRSMKSPHKDKEYVILIWRHGVRDDFERLLATAIDYILNLENYLLPKFVTLTDLQRPADIIPIDPIVNLPIKDKMRLLSISGASPRAEASDIIGKFFGPDRPSDTRFSAVAAFVKNVLRPSSPEEIENSRNIQAAMLGAQRSSKNEQGRTRSLPRIEYVRNETPPDTYTADRLISSLDEFDDLCDHRDFWEKEILSGNEAAKTMVSVRLKQRDIASYQAPKLIWTVSDIMQGRQGKDIVDGPIPPKPIISEFIENYLVPAGLPRHDSNIKRMAAMCGWSAARKLFRLPSMAQNNPIIAKYHVHISDTLLDSNNKILIQKVAFRLFLKWYAESEAPHLLKQFSSVLEELPDIGGLSDIPDDDEALDN
jgi:hypothetical protein